LKETANKKPPLVLPLAVLFYDILSNYFDNILSMKKLRFIGSSLDDLKNFPVEARKNAGFELDTVQRGNMPSDFKPLLSVGTGAYEIRIHVQGEWRVIYVAKFDDAVYVLHAFHKTTQKNRREDIELAARRYKQLVNSNDK
jgi:phage-related protein